MSDVLTMSRSVAMEGWARSRRRALTSLRRAKTALFGFTILLLVACAAVFTPMIAPSNPNKQALDKRFLPPLGLTRGEVVGTADHLLGTDHLGRDILSRILYGARISLIVGLSAVAISGTIGVVLGLLAGYYGGRGDAIIMRLADLQLAFPFVLLAIAIVAVVGIGVKNVIAVLGLAGWVVYARIVRGDVLSIREREFVLAARVIGATNQQIIFRHILPNVLTPVIVVASFAVANVIILEAALSFLGLGVEPSIPTWGAMLADGRTYLSTAWWPATLPGLAIMFTVLGINMIGDWLRDVLDPRLRNAS